MKIKDIPINCRPREKLIKYGVRNISDEDLLSIIIKTGTKNHSVYDISYEILSRLKGIEDLSNTNYNTFKNIKGLGYVKIIELLAAIELGKRIFIGNNLKINEKYDNPDKIYLDNKYLFQNLKQEYFYCIYLDNKNRLIERKLLFMGTVNRSVVHPREIFKEAYLLSASGIICMHNHPSGDINPSHEDIEFTSTLVNIGKIQDIKILDHLIIGNNSYYSFYNNNIM